MAGARPSLDDYRDHLGFLLGFHEPLEVGLRAVRGLSLAVPDLERRYKTPSLRSDLGAADTGRRARPALIPAPCTHAQALGVLYVTEGATLGARTLLPRLQNAGVVPGPVGTRYLRGYGRRAGAMWRQLCRRLDELTSAEANVAVAWALLAFEGLHVWRSDWEAHR